MKTPLKQANTFLFLCLISVTWGFCSNAVGEEGVSERNQQTSINLSGSPAVSCKPNAEMRELLSLHNQIRSKKRRCAGKGHLPVPPLSWSCSLANTAQRHSQDMFDLRRLGHKGRDGADLTARIERSGYSWRTLAENVARGYQTPKLVVKNWLESGDHCLNIMSDDYRQMGAAKVGNYWTVIFARED